MRSQTCNCAAQLIRQSQTWRFWVCTAIGRFGALSHREKEGNALLHGTRIIWGGKCLLFCEWSMGSRLHSLWIGTRNTAFCFTKFTRYRFFSEVSSHSSSRFLFFWLQPPPRKAPRKITRRKSELAWTFQSLLGEGRTISLRYAQIGPFRRV